jgi:hypothetical protein
MLKKREKVTTAVHFPEILDTNILTVDRVDEEGYSYQLQSILLHTGTANSGHYKAYVRENNGQWLECNDSVVSNLTSTEQSLLFQDIGNRINDIADLGHGKSIDLNDFLRENAYMLIYEKMNTPLADLVMDNSCSIDNVSSLEDKLVNKELEACSAAIPSDLIDIIENENLELRLMRQLLKIHEKIVSVKVFCNAPLLDSKSGGTTEIESISELVDKEGGREGGRGGHEHLILFLLNSETMDMLLNRVCTTLQLESTRTGSREHKYRLRSINESNNCLGNTYGLKGGESLLNLGFLPSPLSPASLSAVFLLEFRNESEPPFKEFNNKSMTLKLIIWSVEINSALLHADESIDSIMHRLKTTGDKDIINQQSDEVMNNVVHNQSLYNSRWKEDVIQGVINPYDETLAAEEKSRDHYDYEKDIITLLLDATHEILVPGELTSTLGALRVEVCMYIYMYLFICMYVYVKRYTYIFMYMYIYMYIYTYTYM